MSVGANVSNADKAVSAAERRKLPVPDAVYEAQRLRTAVFETGRTPDPERPALPDTAAEAAEVIRQHAEALRLADVTRRAANLFSEEADTRYVQATIDAVPAWVAGLEKEFTALVTTVRKAAAKLPEDLSRIDARRMNWNNPVHTVAHEKASGAVAQLEQLVSDRADIAQVAGSDGGRDNALYAVAAMPDPTTERVMAEDWKQLSPAISRWRELRGQPVARWVYLVRQQELTLSLATPGEVRQRSAVVERWRDAGHAARAANTRKGAEANVRELLTA
ncbi:hypothetical protein OHA61_34210 [Streptomyces sp. NBC_00885]|uniref:hypothetical protein n=1 Tax=Streptomyces sp. NBC_00885 TaxID=2975857 RepID=UPI00386445EA|nr:hypothetical protein OHA61_34210 [Streptomyces sp. NBC_00885]